MKRDARLIANRRQQLELELIELVGAVTVNVKHAKNRIGRSHWRAHDRSESLAHDALAGRVSLVGEGVMREGGDPVLEDIAHDGARQHHFSGCPRAFSHTHAHNLHTLFTVTERIWR